MATPLILDVDTGVDDALAILYAVASPDVDLIACTSVMGNVTVERATTNTLAVLELAGHADVEVAVGAERPLVQDHEPFPVVHGPDGLGNADLPPPASAPSDRSAARAIVELAAERPGEVVLVATGPLTNVAVALTDEPALPALLRGFAIMGGAYDRSGNATPAAEANIWVDPEAAAAVFRAFSGVPADSLPLCVGLDVTEDAMMTPAHLDEICAAAPSSALARFLQESVPFYMDFYGRTRGFEGACMHDPLALAAAIEPTLCSWETTRVEIETDGRWTRGETVTDRFGIRTSPWPVGWAQEDNARVAFGLDRGRFTRVFVERLRALVASTA
ncbi:MAG TPA: nucleoside hydrolase [Actinomycetota bacterium]|nr:nucleoside hydrolase [Actinomycetota bacterium]